MLWDFSLVSLEPRELCHCIHQALVLLKFLVFTILPCAWVFTEPLFPPRHYGQLHFQTLGLLWALLLGTGWQHGQLRIVIDEHFPPLVPSQQMCPVQMRNSVWYWAKRVFQHCWILKFWFSWHRLPCLLFGGPVPSNPCVGFPLILTAVCDYAQFGLTPPVTMLNGFFIQTQDNHFLKRVFSIGCGAILLNTTEEPYFFSLGAWLSILILVCDFC